MLLKISKEVSHQLPMSLDQMEHSFKVLLVEKVVLTEKRDIKIFNTKEYL
jgi:hypothetical protein